MPKELRIIASDYPPFYNGECIPNGTTTFNVTQRCASPGIEVQVLALLLARAGILGKFFTASSQDRVDQGIHNGDYDMSGFTYSTVSYMNDYVNLTYRTLPVFRFGAQFIAPIEDTRVLPGLSPTQVYKWQIWLTVFVICLIVARLTWRSVDRGYHSVQIAVTLAALMITLISGLYSNVLAVQLSRPFTSRSPFNSTKELAEKLENGECKWYANTAVIESMPQLFYDEPAPYYFSGPKVRRLHKQFRRIAHINPVIPIKEVSATAVMKLLKKLSTADNLKCHTVVTWALAPTVFVQLSLKMELPIVVVRDHELSVESYGFIFRPGMSIDVREEVDTTFSSAGVSKLYKNFAYHHAIYEAIHYIPGKQEEKRSAKLRASENSHTLRTGNLVQIFEILGGGCLISALCVLLEQFSARFLRPKLPQYQLLVKVLNWPNE